MTDKCPNCGAPPGTCWSQSASMGGKPYCYRDITVGFTRDDWIAYITPMRAMLQQMVALIEKSHMNTPGAKEWKDKVNKLLSVCDTGCKWPNCNCPSSVRNGPGCEMSLKGTPENE